MKATLILENGRIFHGESIGSPKDSICEIVFNTSMAGYQEILTDASYAGLGIVMTYPLIGNYGVNSEDNESRRPWAEAFIVRRLSPRGSNFRCEESLNEYLIRHGITGISGVDTRAITRMIRQQGAMNGVITTDENYDLEALLEKLKQYRVSNTVSNVTRDSVEHINGAGPRVAMLDFGIKENMIKSLKKRGCDITIYPAFTKAEKILRSKPDGIMLSNGPGDPADCEEIIEELKLLYDSNIPILGVCLGHQLMALATGAKTEKMKYGHRGANQPVRDIDAGRIYITSQNHGYVVVESSVDPKIAKVSHVNVNDDTVEGLRYANGKIFTVQFHPEASPGPADTGYLFDQFMDLMEGSKNA